MRVPKSRTLLRELDVHREELHAQNEELRRLNIALVTAKERTARLYDVAPIGYFTLDADGLIIEANFTGAELLGERRDLLFGRNLEEFIAPTERDAFRRLRRAVEGRKDRASQPTTLSLAKGPHVAVWLDATWLVAQDGTTQCLICMSDQTTRIASVAERRRVDAKLAEAERVESMARVLGGAAADFNNLLSIIITCTDLALGDVGKNTPASSALTEVRAAARRAAELSAQLLACSGHARLNSMEIDLSAMVISMEKLLRLSAAKDVSLELELANDVPSVMGDGIQLRQIVLNLVVNAIEAIASRPGKVIVRTRAGESSGTRRSAVLEVIDDGPGMDEVTRAHAFDPFFTTKTIGRGLGLAVVQGNARSHGGVATIESVPMQGTTVRVTIPALVT